MQWSPRRLNAAADAIGAMLNRKDNSPDVTREDLEGALGAVRQLQRKAKKNVRRAKDIAVELIGKVVPDLTWQCAGKHLAGGFVLQASRPVSKDEYASLVAASYKYAYWKLSDGTSVRGWG